MAPTAQMRNTHPTRQCRLSSREGVLEDFSGSQIFDQGYFRSMKEWVQLGSKTANVAKPFPAGYGVSD
jgi:hypothetical protein